MCVLRYVGIRRKGKGKGKGRVEFGIMRGRWGRYEIENGVFFRDGWMDEWMEGWFGGWFDGGDESGKREMMGGRGGEGN